MSLHGASAWGGEREMGDGRRAGSEGRVQGEPLTLLLGGVGTAVSWEQPEMAVQWGGERAHLSALGMGCEPGAG